MGENDLAKQMYREFLFSWKSADPDLPRFHLERERKPLSTIVTAVTMDLSRADESDSRFAVYGLSLWGHA